MAAAIVYTNELYKRKHGRPIYLPEDEIHPGDVGFFRPADGSFCRLFNCIAPADHPVNAKLGVPPGYKPLVPLCPKVHFTYYDEFLLAPQAIVSKSVVAPEVEISISGDPIVSAGAGMTYKCLDEQGAVLLFGSRLARVDLCDTEAVRNYIEDNIDSWYQLAKLHSFGPKQVPEGSIVLVSGCDKAPSFALAAFWKHKKEASVSFQGGFVKTEGVRVHLQGTWEQTDVAECRIGKPACSVNDPPTLPTCTNGNRQFPFFPSDCMYTLFARVWKIKRSRKRLGVRVPMRMKAAAGPHALPRAPSPDEDGACTSGIPRVDDNSSSDSSNDPEIRPDQDLNMSAHPLDEVLDYMLGKPGVEMAIVSDHDLYAFHQTSDSDAGILSITGSPRVDINKNGVARLVRSTIGENDLISDRLTVSQADRPSPSSPTGSHHRTDSDSTPTPTNGSFISPSPHVHSPSQNADLSSEDDDSSDSYYTCSSIAPSCIGETDGQELASRYTKLNDFGFLDTDNSSMTSSLAQTPSDGITSMVECYVSPSTPTIFDRRILEPNSEDHIVDVQYSRIINCSWANCTYLFHGEDDDKIMVYLRDHFQRYHPEVFAGGKDALPCRWTGCRCCSLPGRCHGRPSSHSAHVTDVITHIGQHHLHLNL